MKQLKISANANPNYLATVCRVEKITPIKNSDHLVKTVINGYDIVISNEVQVGDIVIYFPLESVLCSQYLSENNLYCESLAERNANFKEYIEADEVQRKSMCGFFGKQGRVKLVCLRKVYSQGYITKPETLKCLFDNEEEFKQIDWNELVGTQFDTIDENLICWKYIPPLPKISNTNETNDKTARKAGKKLKRIDKMIPGQFNFHYDTKMLAEHIRELDPNDIVTLSVKIHGTSIIISNILCNKSLKWWQKALKKLGVKIIDKEYSNIYSSRKTIKNQFAYTSGRHDFYNTDIWGKVNEVFKSFLTPGMSVYGEVCGYIEGTSTYIQKEHDYGCEPGEWKFMPYRITETDEQGNVKEWNVDEVINWTLHVYEKVDAATKKKIMPLAILYHGRFGNLYKDIAEDENWYDNVLYAMKHDYFNLGMELKEPFCINNVPREGIVIRKDNDKLSRAWKLKTNAHYALETKQHDKQEADIEEIG